MIWAGKEDVRPYSIAPSDCGDACDAPPNIHISYRGYMINYGHIETTVKNEKGKTINLLDKRSPLRPGQTIGVMISNQNHLHLGVKSTDFKTYYNPLFYFSRSNESIFIARMKPYPDNYNPYSFYSFSTKKNNRKFLDCLRG